MNHRTRFAPSPTGFLHMGHVVSALHARDSAGEAGDFLIRIEDIDRTRCKPAFTQALLQDLDWLGFRSSESIRTQSSHFTEYKAALDMLWGRDLLYPCTCTRAEIATARAATAPDGSLVYPGTCRDPVHFKSDRPPVWRLDMEKALEITGALHWHEEQRGKIAADPAAFGDVVLARRDNGVSYHLCVAHDDALQGIDLVTRGMDLYQATAIHRVLQVVCGWPEPRYAHHPLVLGTDGQKLAKRTQSQAIRDLRAAGSSAASLLAQARAFLNAARCYSGG